MTTNADITIFHKVFYSDTKTTSYKRYIIRNVHLHSKQMQQLVATGMARADLMQVRIPMCAVDERMRVYGKEADTGHWTVAKGDFIVRGICNLDISSRSDLTGYEFGVITDISVNDFGLNPHIRIGADA